MPASSERWVSLLQECRQLWRHGDSCGSDDLGERRGGWREKDREPEVQTWGQRYGQMEVGRDIQKETVVWKSEVEIEP